MLGKIVVCVVVGVVLGALAAAGEFATIASDTSEFPDHARVVVSAAWYSAPVLR